MLGRIINSGNRYIHVNKWRTITGFVKALGISLGELKFWKLDNFKKTYFAIYG